MRLRWWKSLPIIIFLCCHGITYGLTIDDFDANPQAVSSNGLLTSTIAASQAIGGSRTMAILTFSGSTTTSIMQSGGLGFLIHNESTMASGSSLITWDAAGAGLGGVDITNSSLMPFFELGIFNTRGAITLIMRVAETSASGGETATYTSSNIAPGSHQTPFSSFTNATQVNFAAVDSISLEIQAGTGAGLGLDFFRADGIPAVVIPEPSTVFLMGTILAGLGIARLRRKAREGIGEAHNT